jgi:hypothetical protein
MIAKGRIRWKLIVLAGFFAEATVFVIFFLLLLAANLAGVPEIARPLTTLDYIDAMVSSFATMFMFTLWVGRRIDTAFVLHGLLIGAFGVLLFYTMWVATTGSLMQPAPYVVAHLLKVLGGVSGGLVAKKRNRRVLAANRVQVRG